MIVANAEAARALRDVISPAAEIVVQHRAVVVLKDRAARVVMVQAHAAQPSKVEVTVVMIGAKQWNVVKHRNPCQTFPRQLFQTKKALSRWRVR